MCIDKSIITKLNDDGTSAVFYICNDIEELASIEWEILMSDRIDTSFAQEWDDYFTQKEV